MQLHYIISLKKIAELYNTLIRFMMKISKLGDHVSKKGI